MHSIIISRQLPDFLLALDAKPSARPRPPRPHSSSSATSRSSRSGTQKLRYAAYEPPPPARPRHPSAASSTSRSTPLDSYEDLARTVTAGDLAIAAGSPQLRVLSSVRSLQFLLCVMVRSSVTRNHSPCRAHPSRPH